MSEAGNPPTKRHKKPSWGKDELRLYDVIHAAVTDALLDKEASEVFALGEMIRPELLRRPPDPPES